METNYKRIAGFALSRKGKSEKQFRKFKRWNEDLVSLVSHLIFDGEIAYRGCIYNNRNDTLLEKVEKAMAKIYKHTPKRYVNKVTGVKRISYYNVALAAYVKQKSDQLITNVSIFPKRFKRKFVEAFFDDEGCIDYRPKQNRRKIRGYQKNIPILHMIKKLLEEFEIESRIVKPNEVVISGKENLQKFQKEINFSPGVKLNENRSNSIWKKPLEKRFLLDQAIKSFKS